jgi:transcriptional regulator with XRE-family HTH domain
MRQTLKIARKEAGIKQRETASAIGISLRYYQDREAGEREGRGRIWDALEALFDVPQRKLRENYTQRNSNTNETASPR